MAVLKKSNDLSDNGNDKNGYSVPEIVKQFYKNLKKSSQSKQLTAGVISGVATGYLSCKFGKVAAIFLGGGMLVIQVAQYNGYISIDWKKVNQDVEAIKEKVDESKSQLPVVIEKIQCFVKDNMIIAGGFASGFLIGFALA